MKILKQKKANIVLYLSFIISAIMIILIASVFAPLGVALNSRAYEVGETLMLSGNESISNIQDADVKANIQESITDSLSNVEYTIELNSNLFKYSWVLIVGLTALILFLFQRRMVEIGQGGMI